jgi:hypothetical protein
MNCNIVDGENTKIRTVSFEDIEKIVQQNFNDKIQDENQGESYEKETEMLCSKIDYDENYLKKDLVHIMNYYELSTRKKKKSEIIDDIIEFESQPENYFVVEHRKTLWYYLEELENDHYLSKFIIKK